MNGSKTGKPPTHIMQISVGITVICKLGKIGIMNNKWINSLFAIIISCCLNSCMLVNAPFYIRCFENSEGSPGMDKALELLWESHPENRVDLQTLKSVVKFEPRLLTNGEFINTIKNDLDSLAQVQIERRYFKSQSAGMNDYYILLKSADNKMIYQLKYFGNTEEKQPINTACLNAIIYLPIETSSRWNSYFDLKPSERNRVRNVFKKDILVKLQ